MQRAKQEPQIKYLNIIKKQEKNVRENATQISVAFKSLIIVPKSML